VGLPLEIVDAHHHLWDLRAVDYPWLQARGVRRFFGDPTPIQRDYTSVDFRSDWEELPVVASVHIQVGAAPPQSIAETAWLEDERARAGLPDAIVAFADLTAPDLDEAVSAHLDASNRVRGIRQIVSRHATEDTLTGSTDLLVDPRFLKGLRHLAVRDLSFDLQLSAPLLGRAATVLADVPDLRIALCHAGGPWDRSASGLRMWREGLVAMAALPNVSAKLSGLGMFDPDWTRSSLAPILEGVLEAFGPSRTMWGSNFPVDKLYRSYRELLETVAELVPTTMHGAVFAGTARRFYRL
jgi:predicted TIM-barrel fold metal-dependent hydrolase